MNIERHRRIIEEHTAPTMGIYMPILEISAQVAFENLRLPVSSWPQRGEANRKGVLPLPEVDPSFKLNDDDVVFCLGSCFAQRVGHALRNLGFLVASDGPNPLNDTLEWGYSAHLIRYNVMAMANEVRWAIEPEASFQADYFLDEPDGKVMDPHGHINWEPHPKEFQQELRAFTTFVTRRIPYCRLVVLTLGLAEVWFDTRHQLYMNIHPSRTAMLREPDRFTLRVLSYEDVLSGLEEIYALLLRYGYPDFKILLTTSPVPLSSTFRGQDVLTANTYSKAVQRAAAEEFTCRHPNVDYFPSYEAITLGNSEVVWDPDQRHVSTPAVHAIMQHVIRAYAPHKQRDEEVFNLIATMDAEINAVHRLKPEFNLYTAIELWKQQRAEIERLSTELREVREHAGG